MTPETRKRLAGIATFAVAFGLLLLIFRVVPFADVMRSIRSAEPGKLCDRLRAPLSRPDCSPRGG